MAEHAAEVTPLRTDERTDGRARVLIVAHGHPDIDRGGGEVAAYAQHRLLNGSDRFTSVFFARHDEPWPVHPGTVFSGTGRAAEILMHSRTTDRFLFRQDDERRVWREFREVLDAVRPDIVHFHHYLHLGLELLAEVRRWSASVPILMTLHEYHAICHNDGLMVRTRDADLCDRATPARCAQCFTGRDEQDFTLRERYIKAFFEHVDRFVAPSRFLADRYTDWGIAPGRITVMENVLPPEAARPEASAAPAATNETTWTTGMTGTTGVGERAGTAGRCEPDVAPGRCRLAVFGRLSDMKGTPLLLEALALLPRGTLDRLEMDIHGTGLERMPRRTRTRLVRAVRRLGPAVRLQGAYRQEEMQRLLDGVDWMVVPSRWWENSPVVILEAKRHGVPLITADIGGMAEKVVDGLTGWQFRAGDARSLARTIERAVTCGPRHAIMAAHAARDWRPDEVAAAHLALHDSARRLGERRHADAVAPPGANGRDGTDGAHGTTTATPIDRAA